MFNLCKLQLSYHFIFRATVRLL